MEEFATFPDPIIENDFKSVYSPSDDTYLILDYFKQHITYDHLDGIDLTKIKKILDIGTGTGIIAIFFQKLSDKLKNFNPLIFASDISKEALKCAKNNEKLNNIDRKIHFIQSDLFQSFPDNLRNKFDIIIFNPPYLTSIEYQQLTQEQIAMDLCWNGGLNGYNVLLNFLNGVDHYLNNNPPTYGYYISSSHTNLDQFYRLFEETHLKNEILLKKHIFFEDLILNRITLKNG